MRDDQLQAGLKALKSENKREARRIFADMIRVEPENAVAWWYLAAAIDDSEQKAKCLRQVLVLQPDHEEARRTLARLERGTARATPSGASARPIFDTTGAGDRLEIVEPAHNLPVSQSGAGRRWSPRVGLVFLPLAILLLGIAGAIVVLITLGRARTEGANHAPTSRPLSFNVEGCTTTGGDTATLIFINESDVEISVLTGPSGAEQLLFTLPPGTQATYQPQPDLPTRYAVTTEVVGVSGGGATIEVPPGNTCQVPVR